MESITTTLDAVGENSESITVGKAKSKVVLEEQHRTICEVSRETALIEISSDKSLFRKRQISNISHREKRGHREEKFSDESPKPKPRTVSNDKRQKRYVKAVAELDNIRFGEMMSPWLASFQVQWTVVKEQCGRFI